MVQDSYCDDLSRACSVYCREQIETADHRIMFTIMDHSLICSRATTASVLPKTNDGACPPNRLAGISLSKIHDVCRTLSMFTPDDDVCAVLQGFDYFTALSCDEVKH